MVFVVEKSVVVSKTLQNDVVLELDCMLVAVTDCQLEIEEILLKLHS